MLQDPIPTNYWCCRHSLVVLVQWTRFTLEGGFIFSWQSAVLIKTSFYMWGSWYLPNIPVEGWIINPQEHSLLDGPSNGMCLPTHNGGIIQFGMMS